MNGRRHFVCMYACSVKLVMTMMKLVSVCIEYDVTMRVGTSAAEIVNVFVIVSYLK